jgi:hypothetical protein
VLVLFVKVRFREPLTASFASMEETVKRIRILTWLFLACFALPTWPQAQAATAGDPDYSALFPTALPGWTAGEVEVKKQTADFGGMGSIERVQLTRTYANVKTKGEVQILVDSLDAVSAALIKSAQEKQKPLGQNIKPYHYLSYDGLEFSE